LAGVQQKGGGPISAINVTPFVDVVLVLLVILMVTSVQIVKASLEVDLPSAASGGSAVESTLNIIIEADGTWKLDGAVVDEAALAAVVKQEVAANPKLQAVIAADREVKYDFVMRAIDVVKVNGIKSFALNVQRQTGAGSP